MRPSANAGRLQGVGRRFTQTGEFAVPAAHGGGTFTVIDDYGHHPVEMAATLAAARAWPDRRIVLAFQPAPLRAPATASRISCACWGPTPLLTGCTPRASRRWWPPTAEPCRALRVAGKVEPVFVEDVAELPQAVLDFVRDGDVVIVMGAGSISRSRSGRTGMSAQFGKVGVCMAAVPPSGTCR